MAAASDRWTILAETGCSRGNQRLGRVGLPGSQGEGGLASRRVDVIAHAQKRFDSVAPFVGLQKLQRGSVEGFTK